MRKGEPEHQGTEFVYVQHVPDGGPYDLELIPFNKVDFDCYMTVSPHGVTEYLHGLPKEFVPLVQWMDERQQYRSLRNLRFFREFAARKTFHAWRDAGTHERMCKAGGALEERHFLLQPQFRSLLLAVRALCLEVAELRAVRVQFSQPRTLPEFREAQEEWRKEIIAKAERLAERIHQEVLRTFMAVLDSLRFEVRGPGPALAGLAALATSGGRTGSSLTPRVASPIAGRPAASFARSGMRSRADGEALEALGFPKDLGFAQRSVLRKACARCVCFTRLADSMVTDALTTMALNSLSDIVHSLTPLARQRSSDSVDQRSRGYNTVPNTIQGNTLVFRVEACIEDGKELTMRPHQHDLSQELLGAVQEGCGILTTFQPLATHADLAPFRAIATRVEAEHKTEKQPPVPPPCSEEAQQDLQQEPLSLLSQVEGSTRWRKDSEKLQAALKSTFVEAQEQLQVLAPHLERCHAWLQTNVAAEVADACGSGLVQDLGEALRGYAQEVTELQELPGSLLLRTVDVDISKVKAEMAVAPTTCLRQFQVVLPETVISRSGNVLEWMAERSRQISEMPSSIEVFVKQVGDLENIGLEVYARSEEIDRIRELCDLVDHHKIEISNHGRRQATAVGREFVDFRQWVASKNLEVLQLKEGFTGELDGLLSDLSESVTHLGVQVREDRYLVFAASIGEFGPGEPAPSEALLRAGRVPSLLSVEGPGRDTTAEDVEAKVQQLEALRENCGSLRDMWERYNRYEDVLCRERTPSPDLDTTEAELSRRYQLWQAMQDWRSECCGLVEGSGWMQTPLASIDVNAVAKRVAKIWASASQAQVGLPENPVFEELRCQLTLLQDSIPAISALQNVHLLPRHWLSISDVLDTQLEPEKLLVGMLMELKVANRSSDIQAICMRATQEHFAEVALSGVEELWAGIEFSVVASKEHKEGLVLGPTDHISAHLDDSLMTINAALSSRHAQEHLEAARDWQQRLLATRETLAEFSLCQKQWMYLDRIFSVSDIQKQLMSESNQFHTVDVSWRKLMAEMQANPNVLQASLAPGIVQILHQHNQTMETIVRELEDYFETKRMAFTRLYFVSNDELFRMLAHGRDPAALEQQLASCFDGIARLDFGDDRSSDIHGVISAEGERVGLGRVKLRMHVEETLDAIQSALLSALRRALRASLEEIPDASSGNLAEWALGSQQPAQAVQVAARITWCAVVEAALRSRVDLAELMAWQEQTRLEPLARASRRQKSSVLQQHLANSLIIAEVHGRDVIARLAAAQPDVAKSGADCFEWQKQLRYYWDPCESQDLDLSDPCTVRQLNASLSYAFEYFGVVQRLVVAPLTERCWLAITQSMQLRLGTAISGPPGVGKTETVRDLGKAIAVVCIDFNCSDQVSCPVIGRFLAGLAQQGCWACLDEINHIEVEVLSVMAQQLQKLRQALLAQKDALEFEGAILPLRHSMHVCITMNPGKPSRASLPDNLKALFRPVSMALPDYALVSEVFLFAHGFVTANVLALKLAKLQLLAVELVSPQPHYDFGLRMLKSVLAQAGQLRTLCDDEAEDVLSQETQLLAKALIGATMPRLLPEDAKLFLELVGDVFPGELRQTPRATALQSALEAACSKANLQGVPSVLTKAADFHDSLEARHGSMLLGPAGGGKTTITKALASALAEQDASKGRASAGVVVERLHPKTLSTVELFGAARGSTGEWGDGLLSLLLRRTSAAAARESGRPRWIVCDGDADPAWAERLNAALDEGHVFCLANSERIHLPRELRIVFECEGLAHASPSTVSRCGITYVPEMDVVVASSSLRVAVDLLQDTWMPLAAVEQLTKLVQRFLPEALTIAREAGVVEHSARLVEQVGELLKATLGPEPFKEAPLTPQALHDASLSGTTDEGRKNYLAELPKPGTPAFDMEAYVASCFSFAVVWACGGSASFQCQTQLSAFCREKVLKAAPPMTSKEHEAEMFEVMIDWRAPPSYLVPWEVCLPLSPPLGGGVYDFLIVPTIATACFGWLAFARARQRCNTLIFGPSGCGKSLVAKQVLKQPCWTPVGLHFAVRTDSSQAQVAVERHLQHRRHAVLGPAKGTQALVFIDDVAAPAPDSAGAMPPVELLRQVVDIDGGLYDREHWHWRRVEETALLATAALRSSGSRPSLSPRFLRLAQALHMPEWTAQSLSAIFMDTVTQSFSSLALAEEDAGMAAVVCKATVELLFAVRKAIRPSGQTFFYVFTIRDVARILQGLTSGKPDCLQSSTAIAKFWTHEVSRAFGDRLVAANDRADLGKLVDGLLQTQLQVQWRPSHEPRPLRYGSFLTPGVGGQNYEELQDEERLVSVIKEHMSEYNTQAQGDTPALNLVLFEDSLNQLCRLLRALQHKRGHLLLVGLPGSGRRSLCVLAASMLDVACFEHWRSSIAGTEEFGAYLKLAMRSCSVKGQPAMLLPNDDDLREDTNLDLLATLVDAGHVPNMWNNEELENIRKEISEPRRGEDPPPSREDLDAVWCSVISNIRDLLHVVLLISPVGTRMQGHYRNLPALVTCCNVDYFGPWPEEALVAVAAAHLQAQQELSSGPLPINGLASASSQAYLLAMSAAETYLRQQGRHVYISPTMHRDFVRLYARIIREKDDHLSLVRNRLNWGLLRLNNSYEVVRELEQELFALQPELDVKSEKTQQLLLKVAKDADRAGAIRLVVEAEKQSVNEQSSRIQALTNEAKAEFEAVMPEFRAAVKAVEKLDKKDIQEIKSFTNPPPLVGVVMECVCVLLGQKIDWSSAKNLLSDANFLKRLKEYDKDNIPDRVIARLKTYVKREDFDPAQVEKQSHAARSLCVWCRALSTYDDIAKEVAPKRQRMNEMEAELQHAKDELMQKESELEEVLSKVRTLQVLAEKTQGELAQLEEDKKRTEKRLLSAKELTATLKDEEVRWRAQMSELSTDIGCLPGDVFVAVACVAYFGPFSQSYRSSLVAAWLQSSREGAGLAPRPGRAWRLQQVLVEPATVQEWRSHGLPRDGPSIDSAIVARFSSRPPLCIDPQGQAACWLERSSAAPGPRRVKGSSPVLSQVLQESLPEGTPLLLVECVEELPELVRPLLALDQPVKEPTKVRLGLDEVMIGQGFHLLLTTSLASPHFSPDIFMATSVIDFTVSFDGIVEHFLSTVVSLESPESAAEYDRLASQAAQDQRELAFLDEQVLVLLSKAEGCILDQEDLIETLGQSQEASDRVQEQMAERAAAEKLLEGQRAAYRQVAERGTLLYASAAAMAAVDPVYSCSLQYVLQVFTRAVRLHHAARQEEQRSTEQQEASATDEDGQARNEEEPQHEEQPEEEQQRREEDQQQGLAEAQGEQAEPLAQELEEQTQEEQTQEEQKQEERTEQDDEQAPGEQQQQQQQQSQEEGQVQEEGVQQQSSGHAEGPAEKSHHLHIDLPADESVEDLAEAVTRHVLADLSQGYFEQHRLLVALHFCLQVSWLAGDVSPAQEALLLRGEGALVEGHLVEQGVRSESLPKVSPDVSVFSASCWEAVRALALMEPLDFAGLPAHMVTNLEDWREALAAPRALEEDSQPKGDPEAESVETPESLCAGLPGEWGDPDLPPISQLLLLRTLQPSRLAWGLHRFAERTIGKQCFAKIRAPSFHDALSVSEPRLPVLIVLSHGSDPAAEVLCEAEHWPEGPRDVRTISFGRGRGQHAQRLLEDGVQHGWWVLLQNCHLARSWLPHLERFMAHNLADEKARVHDSFRLFITALPDPHLPPALLQQCAKLAHQPPKGVRAGLLRSLRGVARGQWDHNDHPGWRRLLLGVSLFHAVICERSKFGLLGFSHAYRFTDSDLDAAHAALPLLWEAGLEESTTASLANVPWSALEHLVARVHYGGHATDRFDERCLVVAFEQFVRLGKLGDACASAAGAGLDAIPEDLTDIASARAFAESLPLHDPPAILGLPSAAGAALQPRLAREALEALEAMQSMTLRREGGEVCEHVEARASVPGGESSRRPASRSGTRSPAAESWTQRATTGLTVETLGSQVWGRAMTEKFGGSGTLGSIGAGLAFSVGGSHAGDVVVSEEEIALQVIERLLQDVPQPMGTASAAAAAATQAAAPAAPAAPRSGQPSLKTRRTSDMGLRRSSHGDGMPARPVSMLSGTLGVFLRLELGRLDALLKVVHQSLAQLSDVVAGLASPTEELDAAMAALRAGRVPAAWRAAAYPSCRGLTAWVSDLQDRSAWLCSWAKQPDLPTCFPIARFFSPDGFLTSVLQGFARGTGSRLDELGFQHEVTSYHAAADVVHGPALGVFVSGLFLEGASWNAAVGHLEECGPTDIVARMPVLHFLPVQLGAEPPTVGDDPVLAAKTAATEASMDSSPNSSAMSSRAALAAPLGKYECPLYRTASRGGGQGLLGRTQGLVCTVDLFTAEPPSHWVLRGAALLCDVES